MAPLSPDPMDRLPTGLMLFVRNLQSLTPIKLDDTNYPSWSATVRANLLAHRLLSYVDGSETPPPALILDEKAAAPGKDEPPIMKPNPAYESWLIVDAQIRACLLAIVSPPVPTSAAIWNHLEQRYNSLSRTHIFQLKERLHGVTKGTDSMQTYLDTVLTIVSSLKLNHENISEQDIILCVLRSLPADYASLKQNIRTNIATVTFNQVSSWLLSEELNLSFEKKLSLGDSGSTSCVNIHNALFTNSGRGTRRGRGRGLPRGRGGPYRGGNLGGRGGRQPLYRDGVRGRGGEQGVSVTCLFCGKLGHAVWNCWHRYDESYTGPPQAFYANQSTQSSSNWHLDTGANTHVTPDLSRLHTMTSYHDTNSITTAGGNTYPIDHTGSDGGRQHLHAAAAPSAAAPVCGGLYANGGGDPRGDGGKTQRRRSDLTAAARSETAWLRGGSSTWRRLCGWTAFCTASRSKRSTAALEGMQRRLANGGEHLRRSPLLEQAANPR
ncbi:unnamed protein product [Cuscuta campestris]|uniref:Uncharacterized protein n=1 Tax=Cuscuta campestris TaxID=132261 RepID=A0A484NRJ0_9ASTE|nr:unnamed protein product [Cuscuta campestris]